LKKIKGITWVKVQGLLRKVFLGFAYLNFFDFSYYSKLKWAN